MYPFKDCLKSLASKNGNTIFGYAPPPMMFITVVPQNIGFKIIEFEFIDDEFIEFYFIE
jgi:hypothetical protein